MTFYEWWILAFGHPPLPEEGEIFQHCRSAYHAGAEDAVRRNPNGTTLTEEGFDEVLHNAQNRALMNDLKRKK